MSEPVRVGYTLMGEQRSPKDLVADAVLAEQAGFGFAVASDHYHPWLPSQGHAPYTWSVLGAVAARTERLDLMTYVTCPSFRYHPAVVAQKAATVALLSDNRFRLGLGSGEALNEHIVGQGWPSPEVRHARLREAVEIIRRLWAGDQVTFRGEHFTVDSARIYDLPDRPVPIGIAVSGPQSCQLAGEQADLMVGVEPKPELAGMFRAAGGAGKPAVGQIGVCWGPDPAAALRLAHEQFRWFAGGWKVNAELPNPANFEAASSFVREEDIAEQIPHGPDPQPYLDAVARFAEAGYTEVAFVQIGDDQRGFCDFYQRELAAALSDR